MAGAKKIGLSNQLLGRTVRQRVDKGANDYEFKYPWSGEPNLSGEYFGTIEAAWLEEGTVKVSVRDPHGKMFEGYLTHMLLDAPTQ